MKKSFLIALCALQVTSSATHAHVALKSMTIIPKLCDDSGTATVILRASGGKRPYRYQIGDDEPQKSSVFKNIADFSQRFSVIDANGDDDSVMVLMKAPFSSIHYRCKQPRSSKNGVIVVSVKGGAGPLGYMLTYIDTGRSVQNDTGIFKDLPVGRYQITISSTGTECQGSFQVHFKQS